MDEKTKRQKVAEQFASLEFTRDAFRSTGHGRLYIGFYSVILALGYQLFVYLRHGYWESLGWSDLGWPIPQTNWIGIQRFIDWVADTHVGLLAMILAFVAWIIISIGTNQYTIWAMEKKQQLERLKQDSVNNNVP